MSTGSGQQTFRGRGRGSYMYVKRMWTSACIGMLGTKHGFGQSTNLCCKVLNSASHRCISANTRPHQLCWSVGITHHACAKQMAAIVTLKSDTSSSDNTYVLTCQHSGQRLVHRNRFLLHVKHVELHFVSSH